MAAFRVKIFISWSGEASLEVARALKRWIRKVISPTRPWLSEEDIPPGSLWFNEISKISEFKFGILCMTRQNLNSQWLLWEAGALYREFEEVQRVVPFLIDLEKGDVEPPLNAFQMVSAKSRTEVARLMHYINDQLGDDGVLASDLDEHIENYWSQLEDAVKHAETYPVPKAVVSQVSTCEYTFADAARRYVKESEGFKSLSREQHALKTLGPYVNDLPLDQVDDAALEPFKRDRLEGKVPSSRTKVKVGTVNKELRTVTTILNRAAKTWRWIPSAPHIRPVRGEPSTKTYPITWAEQDLLMPVLREDMRGPALLILNTGLRRQDIPELRWEWLQPLPELGASMFHVPQQKGNKRWTRYVLLNSVARRIIDAQRGNDSEFVFISRRGTPLDIGGKVFTKRWRKAGLPSGPGIRPGVEALRFTFGHRLRAAGVSAEDRDFLIGSSRASDLERNAAPDFGHLLECVERVTVRRETTFPRPVSDDKSAKSAQTAKAISLFDSTYAG